MSISRNELKYYVDVDRIARALERIADALEAERVTVLARPEPLSLHDDDTVAP